MAENSEGKNYSNLLEGFVPSAPQVFNADGSQIADYDYSNFQNDFLDGKVYLRQGDKVSFQSPDGKTFQTDDIKNAINQGYKFDSPEEQFKRQMAFEYGSLGNMAKAGATSTLRGLSIGTSDWLLKQAGVDMEKVKAAEEYNPNTAVAGEVLGNVLPTLITAGGSAAAQGAAGIGKTLIRMSPAGLVNEAGRIAEVAATKALAPTVGTLTKNIVGRAALRAAPLMAQGAVEGAIYGAGSALSESALGNADLNAEYLASEIGMGALTGLSLGGAIGGTVQIGMEGAQKVKQAIQSLKEPSLKAMGAVFNVNPEVLKKYAARAEDLDASVLNERSEAFQDIYSKVDDIANDFDGKKITLKQAQEKFKSAQNDLRMSLQEQGLKASEARDQAKKALKGFEERLTADFDDKISNWGKEISDHEWQLHNDVIKKSQDAMDIARLSDDVNVSGVIAKADDLIKDYEQSGALASNKSVISALKEYADDLKNTAKFDSTKGYTLSGDLVKKRIKLLDTEIGDAWSTGATEFSKAKSRALKGLRYEFDDILKKTSPDYAKAMLGVSEDTKLLKSLSRISGDDFEVSRALRTIGKDQTRFGHEIDALQKLESRYGGKYTTGIRDFVDQKKLVKGSAEAFGLAEAQAAEQMIKNKLKSPMFQRSLQELPEFAELNKAKSEFAMSQIKMQGIDDVRPENVKRLFTDAAKINPITGKVDPKAIERARKVGNALGVPEIDKMIEDASIMAQFEKGNMNGSRNAVVWGAIGSLAASALDSMAMGVPVGIITGGMVDKFGPKMAKTLIDSYGTLSAVESMATKAAKKAGDAINATLGTKSMSQSILERTLPALMMKDTKEQKEIKAVSKTPKEVSYNRIKEIQNVVNNDSYLSEKMNAEISSIEKVAPKIAQAMKTKAITASKFLASKLPEIENTENSLKFKKRPSDFELSKFNKYWEAVDNPQKVFANLAKGIVFPEHSETIKSVYPEMYKEALSSVVSNLSTLKEELPYKKRLAISKFFDIPLDPSMSPQNIMAYQVNTDEAVIEEMSRIGQEGRPGAKGVSTKAVADAKANSKSKMTDTERILTRKS